MRKAKHIAFLLLILCSFNFFGSTPPPGYNPKGVRINLGPSLSFYSLKTKHANSVSAKFAGLVGFKKEVRVDKQYRTFFLFGAEYFFHGANFKSYYFDQDTLRLYDKDFAYDYDVLMQEVNIPLQVKYSLTRENNSLFTPYFMVGYHLRYLLPGRVTVAKDGDVKVRDWEVMSYRTPLGINQLNSAISVTAGWQKNNINHAKTGFYVEACFRYGFSQYLINAKYTPSSLYMNSNHLSLILGIKF